MKKEKMVYIAPTCENTVQKVWLNVLETFSSISGTDFYGEGEDLGDSEDTTW